MDFASAATATILGFVEGQTEFVPVSSIGHLLLAGHFFGFRSTNGSFEVLIRLAAVHAVLAVYFGLLWKSAVTMFSSSRSHRLVSGILLAFLLAAMIGTLAYDLSKNWDERDSDKLAPIAIGFVVSIVTALFVVWHLLQFVLRRSFAPFACGSIGVGLVVLSPVG